MIFYERQEVDPKVHNKMSDITNENKLVKLHNNSSYFDSSKDKDAKSNDMPYELDGDLSKSHFNDDIELGKLGACESL